MQEVETLIKKSCFLRMKKNLKWLLESKKMTSKANHCYLNNLEKKVFEKMKGFFLISFFFKIIY